eukprot:4400965-Pyramimonas_sp.AAC.1
MTNARTGVPTTLAWRLTTERISDRRYGWPLQPPVVGRIRFTRSILSLVCFVTSCGPPSPFLDPWSPRPLLTRGLGAMGSASIDP